MSSTRNDKTSKIFFGWKCSGLYNINDLWFHYQNLFFREYKYDNRLFVFKLTWGNEGGWRWGWRWHGRLEKYPSTHLTIYLFKIYLRVDEPSPYHTHSHELGILYLSKSVYWLYQQQRKLYFCFSIFFRSVISLHNFEKHVRFLKKEEN